VSSIDPATQLAALIRVQVASLRRQPATASGRPKAQTKAAEAGDLAAQVASRIRSLRFDDPQRQRKAFRMFLETVLLSELGQELVGDPQFQKMVDHVQQQMESDPELAKATCEAAALLLRNADAGQGASPQA
jgi:hypothetical protein